jgi:hypothetical protein
MSKARKTANRPKNNPEAETAENAAPDGAPGLDGAGAEGAEAPPPSFEPRAWIRRFSGRDNTVTVTVTGPACSRAVGERWCGKTWCADRVAPALLGLPGGRFAVIPARAEFLLEAAWIRDSARLTSTEMEADPASTPTDASAETAGVEILALTVVEAFELALAEVEAIGVEALAETFAPPRETVAPVDAAAGAVWTVAGAESDGAEVETLGEAGRAGGVATGKDPSALAGATKKRHQRATAKKIQQRWWKRSFRCMIVSSLGWMTACERLFPVCSNFQTGC